MYNYIKCAIYVLTTIIAECIVRKTNMPHHFFESFHIVGKSYCCSFSISMDICTYIIEINTNTSIQEKNEATTVY